MRYPRQFGRRTPKRERNGRKTGIFLISLVCILALLAVSLFLKDLATTIAVSDAADLVTETVNKSISRVLGRGEYGYEYFVNIEKDDAGKITAVSSNMAHINTLSTEILSSIISSTDNGVLTVNIPIGNLTGLNILMSKGPCIGVDIMMLTSSRVDFRNEIIPCGINQAKYQLILEITIDIDVLIPWGTESAQTVTELIVADTIIIGDVPDTYLSMER